jgi:type II secretory ATPase GspE/PulE/Tfp pilus assembly ATPase PilB-like protein/nucleotide-binding universal stress UspA family protein
MTRINRILLATDLNADSTNAVVFVSAMARQLAAELHLLYVISGPPRDGGNHVPPQGIPDDIQGQLDRLTLTASMNRVTTKAAVRPGLPAEEIAAYAKSMEIGLVVMGSRGRSHLAQAILGSVAEQVIRTAPCPVLVLPPACFKLNGRRLLKYVKTLASEFGPGVVGARVESRSKLVHVLETQEQLDTAEADSIVQALENSGALTWHSGELEDAPNSRFWGINPDVLIDDATSEDVLNTEITSNAESNAAIDLVQQAIKNRASDVHIDSVSEEEYDVRLRIDGRLDHYCRLDRKIAAPLIQQLKLMGRLDIADPFKLQEGRLNLPSTLEGREVRITSAPVQYGQSVALRLFDSARLFRPLESLGLSRGALDAVERILQMRSGLVLVTGPTGSGKTTTIYSLLNRLSASAPNIVSIEDPIEYRLPFMTQLAVDPRHGVTMTTGLRTILRMDPDVVFLGEIRDGEAADIAMRAASAGRYVFSTLHTRDVASTITALRDLHVDTRSLSANLVGIVSQRLVRRLCPDCSRPGAATDVEIAAFEVENLAPPTELMHAVGCEKCRQTGYRDRIGIFEAVATDGAIADAIGLGVAESEFAAILRQAGAATLPADGLRKVAEGITTVEEVLGMHSAITRSIPV